MRIRWIVPSSVAFVALLSVILLSQIASQALEPSADLAVVKSVSPEAIAPGRPVTYEVLLDNSTGSDLYVSSLTDTLPLDFEYVGLALDSQWDVEPSDTTPPDIQWSGPITVPPSGLTLRYNVYVPGSVPLRAEPYTNTLVADVDGTLYHGEADLFVAVGEVSMEKTAARARAVPGGVATYTVTFNNSGYVARDLDLVRDVLPQDVSFNRMTDDSDITVNPSGTAVTITWPGPLTVPAQDELVVEYEVTMPPVSDTVSLVNEAWGQLDGAMVGPDSAEVKVGQTGWIYFPTVLENYAPPWFTVSKRAYPQVVFTNVVEAVFTYTVALNNEGTVPGVLGDVRDTLPSGFQFGGMVTGDSDVDPDPAGTTGEIVWTGPFTVAGESALTLVYTVTSPPTIGTYVNSATATTVEDKGVPPKTPGQATVSIREPLYLEEDWENPIDYWRVYTNNWRLDDDQWWIADGEGYNGSAALRHNDFGLAHDALYMYLGPGSDEWTNYRYEAKVRLVQGETIGLWFRGIYDEPDLDVRHIEGYYLILDPGHNELRLMRMLTDEEHPIYPYTWSLPMELVDGYYLAQKGPWYTLAVEVQDSHFEAFVNDQLVLEYDDDTFSRGTVGMKTYKVVNGVWDDILVTPLP